MFWSGGPSPPSPPPPGRIKGKKFALQDALAVGLQIVVHGTPVALLFAGTRCFVCCTTPSALEPVPFSVDLLVAYCRHRLISFPEMVSIFFAFIRWGFYLPQPSPAPLDPSRLLNCSLVRQNFSFSPQFSQVLHWTSHLLFNCRFLNGGPPLFHLTLCP